MDKVTNTTLSRIHNFPNNHIHASVAERSNATDCKSVGISLRWFESSPAHQDTTQRSLTDFVMGDTKCRPCVRRSKTDKFYFGVLIQPSSNLVIIQYFFFCLKFVTILIMVYIDYCHIDPTSLKDYYFNIPMILQVT